MNNALMDIVDVRHIDPIKENVAYLGTMLSKPKLADAYGILLWPIRPHKKPG
jgi:hypothetical protein